MAGIDKSQRKLIFPPRFVPYLEKHRIFELFHELAELLVQETPKDHVTFIKEMLRCAAKRRDKPRIVFWTPPAFDREEFAHEVANILDILEIKRSDLEVRKERTPTTFGEVFPTAEEEDLNYFCLPEYFGEYKVPKITDSKLLGESEISREEIEEEEEETEKDKETEVIVDPCMGYRVCPCKREPVEVEKEPEVVEEESSLGQIEEEATKISTLEPCKSESTEIFIDYGALGKCEYAEKGWILVDFPKDADEAEYLCQKGAIPTHAIHLITDTEEEKTRQYKYMFKDWKTVYKSVPVMDIYINGRNSGKLAQDICRLLRIMPHRHAPMLPRVVLIGCRGSGATTQAKLLSRKYKMVHVEFREAIAQVLLQDDSLSERYKLQKVTRPDPELEAAILERILLSPPCRKRGWVLTGYPTTIDQMRMLDIIATPPNRIIFIEVPAKECFIRLYYRKTDWTDGKEYKIPCIEPFGLEVRDAAGIDPEVAKRLLPHPRDDKRRIIHDIEEFFEEKEIIMKYCGRTAAYVNGNKSIDAVFELIDQVIINPAPAESVRNPLAINYGIQEAYQRLKNIRIEGKIMLHNNMMKNPPDLTIKF